MNTTLVFGIFINKYLPLKITSLLIRFGFLLFHSWTTLIIFDDYFWEILYSFKNKFMSFIINYASDVDFEDSNSYLKNISGLYIILRQFAA